MDTRRNDEDLQHGALSNQETQRPPAPDGRWAPSASSVRRKRAAEWDEELRRDEISQQPTQRYRIPTLADYGVADSSAEWPLPADLSPTAVALTRIATLPMPAITLPARAPTAPPAPSEAGAGAGGRQVVKSASVIMVGTMLGSVLGLARLLIVNALFYGGASGAFTTALRPVQQISDLVIGGSVSGALIPTFVDYAAEERRKELRRVYSSVANLVALLMIVAATGVILGAPYFVPFETQRFSPTDQQLTVQLVQIAALSLLGLGLYAVGSALLYALKQVVFPAFATSLYHIAVIICGALVLLWALNQAGAPITAAFQSGAGNPLLDAARAQGAHGLAIGAAVGAIGEFALLLLPLRRIVGAWQPVLDLRHPGVRQIVRLYIPMLFGLVVSLILQNLDVTLIGLTSGGAPENATSLASSTALIQFPVGLVSAALAFSVLPLLVPAASSRNLAQFKRTLRLGIRLALLIMVPATVGLFVLRDPIIALLFHHGACGAACAYRTSLALQLLLIQLPFAAVDQIVISSFYARKDTLTPTLAGIPSWICYGLLAIPFAQTIGMPAIALADASIPVTHTIVLFIILIRQIGDPGILELASGAARVGLAAAGMAAVCWGLLLWLPQSGLPLFSSSSTLGALVTVVGVGAIGAGVYFGLAAALRVNELNIVTGMVRARLGR